MRKTIINWLTIIFSIISIFIGVLKLFNGFDSYTISIGVNYVTIPISTSLYYIFIVNIIGGVCVVYYSYKTKKPTLNKLSNTEVLTGLYSILIALVLLVKLFVLLTGFGDDFINHFIIFLIVLLLNGLYPLFILILAFKTFNLKSN